MTRYSAAELRLLSLREHTLGRELLREIDGSAHEAAARHYRARLAQIERQRPAWEEQGTALLRWMLALCVRSMRRDAL